MRIRIEDAAGKMSVRSFRGPKIVIGRQEDCDLILNDGAVSKVHAEIVQEGAKHLLRDLQSSNGTFLNGQRTSEAGLSPGDRIRVGKAELVFLAHEVEERPGETAPPGCESDTGPPPAPTAALPLTAAALLTLPAAAAGKQIAARAPVALSRPVLSIIICSLGVLTALVVVLALLLSGRAGNRDSDSAAAVAGGVRTPPSPPADAAVESPDHLSTGAAPEDTKEDLAAVFAEKAEYVLLARCAKCHDGTRGAGFVLHDGFEGGLRSALNLAALRPHLDWRSPRASPLLLKGAGEVPHEGGAAAGPEETARIASFLVAAAEKLEGGAAFLFPSRPAFPAPPAGVPLEKEILLRRVYLDLLGRPPLRAEIEVAGSRSVAEVLEGLISGDEYRRVWKEEPAGPLREVWGEADADALPAAEVASRLAPLYGEKLAERAPRRKTPARLARCLFVDLRDRLPQAEETTELEVALETSDGEVLPLAAFLLGEVKPAEDREAWIDRLHARFFLRPPEPAERSAAKDLLGEQGGARILVLGLASSAAYRSD